jgi:hypothetical protein
VRRSFSTEFAICRHAGNSNTRSLHEETKAGGSLSVAAPARSVSHRVLALLGAGRSGAGAKHAVAFSVAWVGLGLP